MSLGDFDSAAVVYFKFTSFNPSTGAPFTLAGTPALSVYKDNSTTQTTTGVTLTVDFDSVTGLNHVAIDTSDSFYSAGSFFDVVITTGTVNSVSAVGSVVGRFTIRKTSALKPTTSGRTLDVSSGGEAGIDWANVGSPTTTLNLSDTTISTSQQVASVTNRVTANADQWNGVAVTGMPMPTYTQPTGFLAATFPTTVSNLTAGGVRTELATELGRIDVTLSTRLATSSYTTPPTAAANATAVRTELATELGRIDATVSSRLAGTAYTAAPTSAANATAVWDSLLSAHTTAGTFGGRLPRSDSSNVQVKLTGSAHIAADIHELQPAVIEAQHFAPGAIDAAALATDAVNEMADGLLDRANGIETGLTLRQALRLDTAALVGKLSGADGTTVTIRNVGDAKNRIVATVDANGNRLAVTTDAT